jgi:hypothetical protein
MADKLSNVIGAPFEQYVLEQLYVRAARNSTSKRSTEEVLFLANKTAWVRMISSVNIAAGSNSDTEPLTKFYEKLELGDTYTTPDALARNWILEAGTSKNAGQGSQLRYGVSDDGSYGLGGTEELGYRPMPGLDSVQIETAGRLGSLRIATVRFKVWNMNQLNVVEALYFRLGYSMLLEWGHTQYFANPKLKSTTNGTFTITTNTYGIDNPFSTSLNKTLIQQNIKKKSKEMSGNYDGMLGIVSNFTWAFNQEGGYDCTVKLIGLGAIIDTMRINQSYKMPPGIVKAFKKASQAIQDEIERRKAEEAKAAADRLAKEEAEKKRKADAAAAAAAARFPVIKNFDELYQYAVDLGGFVGSKDNFTEEVSYYPTYFPENQTIATFPDYFFVAGGVADADLYNKEVFGLFLQKDGAAWVPLHQNTALEYGGAYFTINQLLLAKAIESIIEETNLLRDSDKEVYRKSTYKTPIARYVEAALPLATAKNFGAVQGAGLSPVFVFYSGNVTEKRAEKDFEIRFTVRYNDEGYQPTVKQFLNAVDDWLSTSTPNSKPGQLYLTNFEVEREYARPWYLEDLFVTGISPKFTIPNVPYTGPSKDKAKTKPLSDVQVWFEMRFDNTGLIDEVGKGTATQPAPPTTTQPANDGNTTAAQNQATPVQTEAAEGYESALHVMLSYVKTVSISKALDTRYRQVPVIPVDILDATKTFYQDGIFKNVLTTATGSVNSATGVPFDLTKYAQKGFNSYLLADGLSTPSLYDQVPFVDFKALSKAYLVQYQISGQTTDEISFPVYITLGYLMAFLNNMCLIYDSKQEAGSNKTPSGDDKTPYVFLDFNPETNYCLTSPQHLSIDPTICLIPFNSSDQQYRDIFPDNVVSSITGIYKPQSQDFLSGQIPAFKTQNPYQGRTMNILLNVDYLMNLAHTYALEDPDHSVNLKRFLEQIVVDVNKSLGNINLFSIAYRDDSNTLQIKDDQFVPPKDGESTAISRIQQGGGGYGNLPIFGLQSLVREFQFKTNLSTKLSSMIAISAQAATGSVNSIDGSSMSYLNRNYVDRFKPFITDASANPAGTGAATKTTTAAAGKLPNNDVTVAEHFNTMVKNVYSNFTLDVARIETAKNYYIERLSKVKSEDPITSAAIPIPADLDMTIDGIAGIVMGNAFTIPESRLPLSLRGENGVPKVGFIVAGLVHIIENNEWLTRIKGQMIKLRETAKYGTVTAPQTASAPPANCKTSYPELKLIDAVQLEIYPKQNAINYLKANYPSVGKSVYAIMTAEARTIGKDKFRSAGGNNFGGVQTDGGRWGFGTFVGQFCRPDVSGNLRMFAAFSSPEAFMDFVANRALSKGFAGVDGEKWVELYVNKWVFRPDRKDIVKGTATFNNILTIFNDASKQYDRT